MKKRKHKKKWSRIGDKFPVPRELFKYFWSLTEDCEFSPNEEKNDKLRKKHHHFLAHLYKSTCHLYKIKNSRQDHDRYIPIANKQIARKFGRRDQTKFDVLTLTDFSLIEVNPHNRFRKKSNEYRLPNKIWNKARKIEDNEIQKHWHQLTLGKPNKYRPVNLMNGARIKDSVKKNRFTAGESTKASDVVKKGIKSLSPCIFNPKYAGYWVNGLEKAVQKSKKSIKELESLGATAKQIEIARAKHLSLYQKYQNERNSQKVILTQQPVKIKKKSTKGDPLYKYKAAYKPQVSGRLTEIGGGLQNATRIFKYRMFKDIDTFYNYDLKSAHANILCNELEMAGIGNKWLVEYLSDPDAKQNYANKLKVDDAEIDPEIWKKCLYAAIMGATPSNPQASVNGELKKYFKGNKRKAWKANKLFQKHAGPLIEASSEWRELIFSGKSKRSTYNHIHYWKNACNMKYKRFGILPQSKTKQYLLNFREGTFVLFNDKTKIQNELKRNLASFFYTTRTGSSLYPPFNSNLQ